MCKERIEVYFKVKFLEFFWKSCRRSLKFNQGNRLPGHGSNSRLSEYDVRHMLGKYKWYCRAIFFLNMSIDVCRKWKNWDIYCCRSDGLCRMRPRSFAPIVRWYGKFICRSTTKTAEHFTTLYERMLQGPQETLYCNERVNVQSLGQLIATNCHGLQVNWLFAAGSRNRWWND